MCWYVGKCCHKPSLVVSYHLPNLSVSHLGPGVPFSTACHCHPREWRSCMAFRECCCFIICSISLTRENKGEMNTNELHYRVVYTTGYCCKYPGLYGQLRISCWCSVSCQKELSECRVVVELSRMLPFIPFQPLASIDVCVLGDGMRGTNIYTFCLKVGTSETQRKPSADSNSVDLWAAKNLRFFCSQGS